MSDESKCPECGDELELVGTVMLHVGRRRYVGRPLAEDALLSALWCCERQLAAAQAERDKAQAACAEWQEAVDAICDRVLNERDAMAEMDFGNDRVNAVLSIIDDVMPCAPLGQPLLDRLAKAEATIAKLPKYADTGKPFVPGVDPSWVVSPKNGVWNPRCDVYFQHGVSDKWGWNEGGFVTGPFYSTEAAALASKEQPHDE